MSTERRRDEVGHRREAVPSAPPARIESLGLLRRACWDELERAAREREHGWRTLALATVEQGAPELRTVILREVEPATRCVRLYTDARSRKVAQIRAQPLGALLAWCPRLSWQLRLRVHLRVDTDEQAVRTRWARLRLLPASQDYMSPLAPGTPLLSGVPDGGNQGTHFALVHAEVLSMDWLELHADGPRRAVFEAGSEHWVQP